jgi:phosphoesterase RecJ-like protein
MMELTGPQPLSEMGDRSDLAELSMPDSGPLKFEELLQSVRHNFQIAQRVLIVSHVRPDGDAVGSLLGLGLALQESGRAVQMVLEDGAPSSFKKLPGFQQIKHRPSGDFDYIIAVDCSDLARTGHVLDGMGQPDLNIDHHITNLNFAKINLVDPTAVATSAILTEYIPKIDLILSTNVASALLTGIISDTIGFRTSNMTPGALRLAANLMEIGANLPELYQQALLRRSFFAARYWGSGLVKLQRENGLIWTSLSITDRNSAFYPGNDDADLVNVLSTIEDAQVVVIFIEQKDGRVKVSWRSQPGIDVSQIALQFGGGGHPAAAGADVPGELLTVQANVLEATRPLVINGRVKHGS